MTAKFKVLVIPFPGFNTLDMNGPTEVLTMSGLSKYFSVDVAAESDITVSFEGVRVQRTVTLDDKLIASAPHIYDVLVVPGGDGTHVYDQAAKLDGSFMKLILAFAKSTPNGSTPRVLLSICTGAFFLANLGIFNGRYCTTHWGNYEKLLSVLTKVAAQSKSQPGTVIKARFVDSGKNEYGVQVISSGGISCGLDASLHVVRLMTNLTESVNVAQLLDYSWRQTEGVVFGDDLAPAPLVCGNESDGGLIDGQNHL